MVRAACSSRSHGTFQISNVECQGTVQLTVRPRFVFLLLRSQSATGTKPRLTRAVANGFVSLNGLGRTHVRTSPIYGYEYAAKKTASELERLSMCPPRGADVSFHVHRTPTGRRSALVLLVNKAFRPMRRAQHGQLTMDATFL